VATLVICESKATNRCKSCSAYPPVHTVFLGILIKLSRNLLCDFAIIYYYNLSQLPYNNNIFISVVLVTCKALKDDELKVLETEQ